MRRFAILSAMAFAAFSMQLWGFEFDISPQPDGSIDMTVAADWSYGDLPLFSGLRGSFTTTLQDSSKTDSYVATVNRTLSAEADLLGFRMVGSLFDASLALNGKFDRMIIREIGYLDANSVRYFILNDRTIDLALPRLKAEGGMKAGPFRIGISGEYSPWFYVNLAQELTISPLMAKTSSNSGQSGVNAFSVGGDASLDLPGFQPYAGITYDNVGIAYRALSASGPTDYDTLIETISCRFGVVLAVIEIQGLHPSVLARYELSTTTDRPTGTKLADDGKWTFGIGLR